MFARARNYVYDRRKGLATTVGFVGACYLAGKYVLERLEEIRAQVVQDKTARENLRRRFQQNQEDCSYTILALVPTLGDRILEEMNVESVTHELQMQSKAAKARLQGSSAVSDANTSSLSLNTEHPSVTSSMELTMPTSGRRDTDASQYDHLAESAQSWVEQFTADNSSVSAPSEIEIIHYGPHHGSPSSSSGAHLSDSITSASASLISGSDEEPSVSLHSGQSEHEESQVEPIVEDPARITKTKAELWREVKILTFTRTLTILYSTTLLSLLTHIQLNLLGRYKYVQSVIDMEREEKLRERQSFEASVAGLFWGGGDLTGTLEALEEEHITNTLGLFGTGRTGATERKYLTLSWWLLHVGWRDIGDRVRASVEAVFDDVSLKAKLGMDDLERLIKEVRQRIEFEPVNTPQDSDDASVSPPTTRRISFLPSLIPPTPDRLKDVLVQGGLSYSTANIEDPPFQQLVQETRDFISSADFGQVLETCLDHSTDIMFEGLRRSLFPGSASDVTGPPLEKIRFAGLLPGIARWSHAAVNGTPNELVEGLRDVRELAGFSAIIYSSYTDLLQ
ncbi:hypothetical protein M422DRAFT_235620 [Sphaerobolus stellatus SS14]|uniref:Peroxin-3 n=1 Tax=Sphaerobolus stellatus (strain SS14) TaxID=990650 RepID=A0A0C9UTR2_SPHS4|nr:hypothetical protein M422DRAFT_235620 [Sphaerobolus stellatus SS14]